MHVAVENRLMFKSGFLKMLFGFNSLLLLSNLFMASAISSGVSMMVELRLSFSTTVIGLRVTPQGVPASACIEDFLLVVVVSSVVVVNVIDGEEPKTVLRRLIFSSLFFVAFEFVSASVGLTLATSSLAANEGFISSSSGSSCTWIRGG